MHNGIPGNIQVLIEEQPNDTFVRDGQDVIYNLLLDFPMAALGGEAEIPTIDGGKVKIKIEPGTQPGKNIASAAQRTARRTGLWRRNGRLGGEPQRLCSQNTRQSREASHRETKGQRQFQRR